MVALVLVVTATVTWLGTAAAHASTSAPDPSSEASFVSHTNAERTGQGLAALTVAGDLVTDARQHAEAMAAQQRVFDDPNLGADVQGWSAVAENSGEGPSVDSVEQAFMASPPHRANILGPYSQIGVGVVWTGSTLWVAEIFRQPAAPPPAPAAPRPSPPPTSAPAMTAVPVRPAVSPSTTPRRATRIAAASPPASVAAVTSTSTTQAPTTTTSPPPTLAPAPTVVVLASMHAVPPARRVPALLLALAVALVCVDVLGARRVLPLGSHRG